MNNHITTRLQTGPLLADGAMGAQLLNLGANAEYSLEALNLSDPQMVAGVHRAYLEAGAELIETNTFGANRYKLAEYGLAEQVAEINTAGVEIARQEITRHKAATGQQAWLAGSVGPLGTQLAPYGRIAPKAARTAFHEQITALVEAGIDLLLIETMGDLREVKQAVVAARQIASDLPLGISLTFTRDDRTLLGDDATHVADTLAEMQPTFTGLNCSGGPTQLLRLLKRMRAAQPDAIYAVMPNAGWPEHHGGRLLYPATPAYFGRYAQAFLDAGATIVGGCCGTTPAHIAAMRAVLDNPAPSPPPAPATVREKSPTSLPDDMPEPTQLAQKMARGEFVVSVEMDPPKGYTAHKTLLSAQMLAEAGATVINVADSPLARMRMSAWAICHLIQQQIGIETVLHFPTRGRNILRVQGDLLAAHALNVRNVFVAMGDPTSIGDYPDAMDQADIVPTGLLKLITQQFNQGLDHSGQKISSPTHFLAGCALSLTPANPAREIKLLARKLRKGARFAMTQPVFDVAQARKFFTLYEQETGQPLDLPVMVGVLPLRSERHAGFLHNEVPGIYIPETIQARIRKADSARKAGIQIALELLQELRETTRISGVYLMPPFGRYEIAAEIIEKMEGVRV